VRGGVALLLLLVGMLRKFLKDFYWKDAHVLLYMGVFVDFPLQISRLKFHPSVDANFSHLHRKRH
jgi:hypothetical protein